MTIILTEVALGRKFVRYFYIIEIVFVCKEYPYIVVVYIVDYRAGYTRSDVEASIASII